MSRPPRDAHTERLVSLPLIFYSYLTAGVIIALGCLTAYLISYRNHGIYPSDLIVSADEFFRDDSTGVYCTSGNLCFSADEQRRIAAEGASCWYIVLVTSQAFHIWTAKVRRVSIFEHGVSNITTVMGVGAEAAILVIMVYTPGVQGVVGTASVSWMPWVVAGITGIILFGTNEIRKQVCARNKFLAKILLW